MTRRSLSSRAALAAALLAACSSSKKKADDGLHVSSPAWEDQVVYMVMTDRFANGDPRNDDQHAGEYDPADKDRYSGGDLQGIIDRLDYIQGLGATAVWITPPVANMWWDPLQQSGGFHGYWARDLTKVDEHLGTLATYQALSRALHARGMYLIQDVVPNHMGNFFTFTPPAAIPACGPSSYAGELASFVRNTAAVPTAAPTQAPFDKVDMSDPAQRAAAIYHWTPAIADYTDACQEVNYQISDLDDLDTENPVVRQALRESYGYWVREVGVDAFRVDTAKFAPHAFWNDFFHSTDPAAPGILEVARRTGRQDFLAFGEIYEIPDALTDALERKVASYLGTSAAPELPSVLAFPLYGEIGRVFAEGRPTAYLSYRLGKLMDPTLYPNPHRIPTFIDNHDVRRFLSITSPTGEDLLQALAFLFTAPGLPVVYYGTEQGFTETRAAMFRGGYLQTADRYDTGNAVYRRIATLAGIRRAHRALSRGGLEVLYDNAAGPGPFAFRRGTGGDAVLALFNTARQAALVAQMDTGLPAGTVLELLHSEAYPPALAVGPGGRVTAVLPPKAVVVARATSQVVAPPPPGVTIAVTTLVDGQTFTGDVTVQGTVTPASTRLQMVLDANVARATPVAVQPDGSWSVVLPVSTFPTGTFTHDLAFLAPDAGVATPRARFTSSVVFAGDTYVTADPAGDDRGPAGTYTYPLDATFANRHQMDLTEVKLEVGVTTLNVNLTMADFSQVWSPPRGFDHVSFRIFFSLPGRGGAATVMPRLRASVPAGFSWHLDQFSYGWDSVMYTSTGATADAYGAPTVSPTVKVDANARTITFTYDRNDYGLASWSGVGVYVTTWDFDGIGAAFRPLCTDAGQWVMGGGTAGAAGAPCGTGLSGTLSDGPLVMDAAGPIFIP
ncbi:MAG: alpha-amylase [Deltaproteobacteria bacterium]|nr:alpha-amylase [Deltaproteobacteria bacterium]